jgi:hypothetical protein
MFITESIKWELYARLEYLSCTCNSFLPDSESINPKEILLIFTTNIYDSYISKLITLLVDYQ